MTKKLFLPLWVLASISLFLYSYTQVDLSLTLSRASIFQEVQKAFQYVGWFNRPLSAFLYMLVFIILFSLYFWTLKLVSQKKINESTVWKTIIAVTVILTFSYNAFSYDLFNYIFDAKIVTHYHQNPYIHKALDFPNDPMLSFMRWTHRVYPYGPLWLALTVPISFMGGQVFIVTFFLFKILIGSFFVLTVWSISRISKFLKLPNTLLPAVAFGFNPLIFTESLVSSHNDVVMMGLAMFSVYLLLRGNYLVGSAAFFISVGVKFATLILLPAYIVFLITKSKEKFLIASFFCMVLAVVMASLRTNFQPWYVLFVIPFAVFFVSKHFVKLPLLIVSVGAIFYYVPFLYSGNWDEPIPSILSGLVVGTIVVSVIIGSFFYIKKL